MSQKSVRKVRTAARALLTDETIIETTKSIRNAAYAEVARFKAQMIWITRISIFANILLLTALCLTFYLG